MEYDPIYYEIRFTPVFVNNGIEYPFEGIILTANKLEHRDTTQALRFIKNTLHNYFGDDLEFYEEESEIIIHTLSNAQMKILREINEDTFAFPIIYGRSHLKFTIHSYMYDNPPCDGTKTCECDKCYVN